MRDAETVTVSVPCAYAVPIILGAAAVKAAKLTIAKAPDLNLRTGAPAFVTTEIMVFPLGLMVRLRERRIF